MPGITNDESYHRKTAEVPGWVTFDFYPTENTGNIKTPPVVFKTQHSLKTANSNSHSLQCELKEHVNILQDISILKSSWLINEGSENIHNIIKRIASSMAVWILKINLTMHKTDCGINSNSSNEIKFWIYLINVFQQALIIPLMPRNIFQLRPMSKSGLLISQQIQLE